MDKASTPVPNPRPKRLQLFVVGGAAALVFGSVVWAAAARSLEDLTLVFQYAPFDIVPEGHKRQVQIFESKIPPGSAIFYIMDKFEPWQRGLWERSLYPDYVMIPIKTSEMDTPAYRDTRAQFLVQYAIAAGNPLPGVQFEWQMALPDYTNGVHCVLGRLADDVGSPTSP